jgi:hypothetical protein
MVGVHSEVVYSRSSETLPIFLIGGDTSISVIHVHSRELDQVSPTFSWVFNGFKQAIAWLPVSVKCA